MPAIDIEKTIRCHLMACNVPESAIRIVRAENSDIVTVSVTGQYGTKVRDYSMFQLINGKPYVVDEMVSIALWYHGPEPVVATTNKLAWLQSKTHWQQVFILWYFWLVMQWAWYK